MKPYIFFLNIMWGMFQLHVYDHTISVFMSGPKKAKNGTLARQTLGTTHLIHGVHTRLWEYMGRIPPGYTSSHWCVKQKKSQKKRTFE